MLFQPEIPHADYLSDFLAQSQNQALQHALLHDVNWEQLPITIFGKSILQPRLQYWMSDPDIRYHYSGLDLIPNPWHPLINQLRQQLQEHIGTAFNSVLLNYYRDGNDHMGWHSDDEASLGRTPCIASVSLGAERTFAIKTKPNVENDNSKQMVQNRYEICLEDGSLLVMKDQFQQQYIHALPKRSRVSRPRWNLTFRYIHTR